MKTHRSLADEHESDLSDLATFDDIRTAATDGSLRITYRLTREDAAQRFERRASPPVAFVSEIRIPGSSFYFAHQKVRLIGQHRRLHGAG